MLSEIHRNVEYKVLLPISSFISCDVTYSQIYNPFKYTMQISKIYITEVQRVNIILRSQVKKMTGHGKLNVVILRIKIRR